MCKTQRVHILIKYLNVEYGRIICLMNLQLADENVSQDDMRGDIAVIKWKIAYEELYIESQ